MKISAIPNGLEKCMAFFLGKNLVFIDSMQFIILVLINLLNICLIKTLDI